jgi:hypothetical protein
MTPEIKSKIRGGRNRAGLYPYEPLRVPATEQCCRCRSELPTDHSKRQSGGAPILRIALTAALIAALRYLQAAGTSSKMAGESVESAKVLASSATALQLPAFQ